MNEYELYTRVLSPDLLSSNQSILIETKAKHAARIIDDCVEGYALYRYDMDEQKERFMPFFNKYHRDGQRKVPDGLLKFCDYILLTSKDERLYVILVEMKSGKLDEARKQLDASQTFMDYVRESAKRVSKENGYDGFDIDNIHVKKVILKPTPVSRPGTNKAKSKCSKISWDDEYINMPSNIFPLNKLCR